MASSLRGLMAAACLLIPPTLAADTLTLAGLTEEDYYLTRYPVVLAATRLPQPQYRTPVAVTVIDRAMIDASGALDIPDLLRLVPGFQVAHASGNTVTATYHGLADENARRMQVLVDGRPVYSPAIGGVRWTDLALDIQDVERIEVVRGPNTAAYGANAFLGAINIITLDPSQAPRAHLLAAAGNKNMRKLFGRVAGRIGAMEYRLSMGRRLDDGFQSYVEESNGLTFQRRDRFRLTLLNFRGDYIAPNDDQWHIQFGFNLGPRETGDENDPVFDPPRDREVQTGFQQLRWTRTTDAGHEFTLQFYHNRFRNRERVTLPPLSEIDPALLILFGQPDQVISTQLGTTEERFELEFQHTLPAFAGARLLWGASSRLDRNWSPGYYNRDDYIETHLQRLFGTLEWTVTPRLNLNLGAMLEHASLGGSHASPRLALNYQWRENHGFRAGISRAVRMPTVIESYQDLALRFNDGTLIDQLFKGNDRLDVERLTSFELGYLGRFPKQRLTLDVKAFHNELRDRITAVKDKAFPEPDFPGDEPAGCSPPLFTNALVYVNSGAMELNGAELAVSWRPRLRTLVTFNYAYARGKGWALDTINNFCDPWQTENLQDDVPTHTRSLFVMHRLPGEIDVSATWYKVSAMKWLGNGDKLGPQDRLDLRIARSFHHGGLKSQIALTVQNALDEYRDFRDENIFDTRAYLEYAVSLP